jgi:menaquinone-9 beta-reductase
MAEKPQYDLAIAGGGLAGLALALQSAYAGFSVILFEKEEYPFHKVCGEFISFESWDFLESLGLPLSEWDLPKMSKLEVSDPYGKAFKFDLPLGGFGISRYLLDHTLHRLALQKGVTVLTSTKVKDMEFIDDRFVIKTDNSSYTSRVAAGSCGKRSNLDLVWNREFIREKADKLNNYIAVKYHIQYPLDSELIALHNFHNGYCGISRIEADKCCFCYLTTAANLKAAGNSIKEMEKQILYRNPRLKEIFSTADFVYDEPLTISQISFRKKSQLVDHILMVGDAAGMITPLCGNGMSMALKGSQLAFEKIYLFLKEQITREEMEQQYVKNWKEEFDERLWWGRQIQRFFGGNRRTSFFLKTMDRFPGLSSKLIRATHGQPF